MNELAIRNPVRTAKIKAVRKENYRIKTIEIDCTLDAAPGQFLMLWVPGVGERPMSIGDGKPLTISVADVGKVTKAICALKEGDVISFRGPLGKPFSLPETKTEKAKPGTGNPKPILCIGGGYGIVPMHFLAKAAKAGGIDPIVVEGARVADDIIWEKRLSKVCKKLILTTDDGSKGTKGNVMIEAGPLIEGKKVSCVYACGPERMMEAVAKLCARNAIPCQVSIERYMKCGVGVCGSCAIDGKLCCVDGPVFSGEEALSFSEFGKTHRDPTGRTQA
ncbi:MAG: dihydroorotate dehydrogenase electron transfer subunit [Candidatus Micrarchaeota archaeon]